MTPRISVLTQGEADPAAKRFTCLASLASRRLNLPRPAAKPLYRG
jgi:hypothetical protein